MLKMLLRFVAISLLVGSLSSAHASVVYRWVDLTAQPTIGPISASIEIDENYWSLGGNLNASFGSFAPDFGIDKFTFAAFDGPGPGVTIHLRGDYTCDHTVHGCSPSDPPDQLFFGYGGGSVDITFGALLTGSIDLGDIYTGVKMDSADGVVWTISKFASDGAIECGNWSQAAGPCSGDKGLWVLDLSTLPINIPEPTSIALFCVGLLGFTNLYFKSNKLKRTIG